MQPKNIQPESSKIRLSQHFRKWYKEYLGIAISTIFIVVVLPFLYTLRCGWGNFYTTSSANVGQTIGGITAPFVGIIGIWLLYFTLKAQREQIQEQRNKENFEFLIRQFEEIRGIISSFSYVKGTRKDNSSSFIEEPVIVRGMDVITELLGNTFRHMEGGFLGTTPNDLSQLNYKDLARHFLSGGNELHLYGSAIEDYRFLIASFNNAKNQFSNMQQRFILRKIITYYKDILSQPLIELLESQRLLSNDPTVKEMNALVEDIKKLEEQLVEFPATTT
ncbi:MAG: hypothetical protein H9535_03655 [Ignavibacteria bacterium]|nr:hypothetical protein [Ignavibacteria bacterium]